MDLKHKSKLQEALCSSKQKGNEPLTEALVKALEDAQKRDIEPKAA